MRNMIAAFDRAAVRRIGETDSRLLDLVMPSPSFRAFLIAFGVCAGCGLV
jgi:hypothetical protein